MLTVRKRWDYIGGQKHRERGGEKYYLTDRQIIRYIVYEMINTRTPNYQNQ